ncbi:hypothetical protein C8R43DRAFT_983856 [Mycena crocata]|nr:hypothetical protein C8R43DRAFT_983856 [Mycena crocata]
MAHKPHHHRFVHRTAVSSLIGLFLVLVILLAQSPSHSKSRLRAQGRWVAVRRSLNLPPLPEHAKPSSNIPPLALPVNSRFDLKRKRALEESLSFSFADVDAPPQLFCASDALDDMIYGPNQEGLHDVEEDAASTRRRGKERKTMSHIQ